MTGLALVLFWASTLLLGWAYVGYPLLAWAYGRARPVRLRQDAPPPAVVTVGLAVRDAGAEVEPRVADILAQELEWPIEILVASDGSVDATRRIAERVSATDPRVSFLDLPPAGQASAQAQVIAAARGDVIVLTDAETRFAPGFLKALLAPFGDSRVGCTTGVLRWRYDRESDTAQHEGAYWRYEQAVRRWESHAGWLSTATGALLAVRPSVYRPAPAHASLDQMLPLQARAQGLLVLVVPEAMGSDRGTSTAAEQVRSRVRIATQGIEANLRMARHITPWRSPGSALAIWSHKILRWATPWLVVIGGLAALWLVMLGEPGYALAAGAIGAFLLLAGAGYVLRQVGRPLPFATFPLTVLVVNTCFALGWLNVVLRRRIGSW